VLPNVESAAELDCVRDPLGGGGGGGAGDRLNPPGPLPSSWPHGRGSHRVCWAPACPALPPLAPWAGRVQRGGAKAPGPLAGPRHRTDIGPYDLAFSHRLDYYARPPPPHCGDDPLAAAIDSCREAAAAHGKALLARWGEPEELLAAGYHFVTVGEPTALLRAAPAAGAGVVLMLPPACGAWRIANKTGGPSTASDGWLAAGAGALLAVFLSLSDARVCRVRAPHGRTRSAGGERLQRSTLCGERWSRWRGSGRRAALRRASGGRVGAEKLLVGWGPPRSDCTTTSSIYEYTVVRCDALEVRG
jgi:hypothetical protein